MKKTVIYFRTAKGGKSEDISPHMQAKKCREYGQQQGFHIGTGNSPDGKLMAVIVAAIAEFDRKQRSGRIKAGIRAARERKRRSRRSPGP